MNQKIIFFGNERLATGVESKCLTLKTLIEAGYEVSAVVVNENVQSGRKKRRLEVAEVAEENNIPVVVYEDSRQIIELVQQTGATVGVLAAFGRIIKQEVLDVFEYGILNIHPSLLPEYRGSTPIESVILNGDKTASVSIMLLVKAMDAGPTYAQATVDLTGKESKQELYETLSDIGAQSLVELIPDIISGDVKPLEQNHDEATYCPLIDKSDTLIDWTKTAERLEREIRAHASWPGSKATIAGKEIIITEADISEELDQLKSGEIHKTKKELKVQCGDNSLSLKRVKPIGKSEMDIIGFINGLN